LLVEVLYDDRYAVAGFVLQLFAIRALIATFASSSEDLLFASGRVRIQFWGNVIRLVWFVPAVLLGYAVAGFEGFVLMAMLELVPTALYYYYVQFRHDLMIARYELVRFGFALVVIVAALVGAGLAAVAVDSLNS
jgi:O-antigen/teichoic acid export membrane protein